MQLAAIVVSLVLIVVGTALFGRAALQIPSLVRLGRPVPAGSRTGSPGRRSMTLLREFAGHTRMNEWGVIGTAHWFVAVAFYALLLTLVNAFGQLFDVDWLLPVVGRWAPYNVMVEFLGATTVLGILTLIAIRQPSRPGAAGRKSRSAGSNTGQAYFVEAVIVIVGVCIVLLHALEGAQRRHNKVYTPPREIIAGVPGLRNEEMHRHKERGFCCGAGGARMWREERIGKRINNERVDEALSLNPDIVSTACPFCLVMLTDSINGKKNDGTAKETLQVVDVAQLLLGSVRTPASAIAADTGAEARAD